MNRLLQSFWILISVATFSVSSYAQITYFEQDFNGSGPFVNSNPGVGQFTNLIETEPTRCYFGFQDGAMNMIRTQSTMGGSAIAVRSVPFSPNPETLYIQITLTVKEVIEDGNPAVYFYVGENLPTAQFPNNNNVFSRPSISIQKSGFIVRDIESNKNSVLFPLNTSVTMTLVLNNSQGSTVYKMPESAATATHLLGPQRYDLWANDQPVVTGGVSYTPYSPTKLSNFQLRFWKGVGTVSIDNIRIRDIDGVLPLRFKSFNAQLIKKDAELFWEAEEARDSTSFIVQRSWDNIHFEAIGEVAILADSKAGYTFIDRDIPLGITYYRVIQFDNNGQEIAQSIVRDIVKNSAEKSLGIWPNPSDGSVIHIFNLPESASDIKLLNIQGSEIKINIKQADQISIDLIPESHLFPGLYLVTYMHEGKRKSLKVLIG